MDPAPHATPAAGPAPDLPALLAAAPPARLVAVGRGALAALDLPADPPSGAPVVLVPGWTGSKEDFLPLLGPLARAGHRVVAYDQRGQHESAAADGAAGAGPSDPEGRSPYGVAALADDLLALLRALGTGPVHVVGHSFGGLVARAAVLADPAAFRSLVLLASGPAALTGPRVERVQAVAPILEAGGMAALHDALAAQAAADPRSAALPAAWTDFLRLRFVVSSPAALRGTGDALLAEPDRVAELAATGVPVLVLHGDADDAWSPAVQADMARRLGARHVVVAGAAHSPALEAPDATLAALRAFWAGV